MTTLVWHGPSRTLAVDTMVTISSSGNPLTRTEAIYKILDVSTSNLVSRDNEKLLTIAIAGAVKGVPNLVRFIVRGFGEWDAAAERVRHLGGSFLSRDMATSALVVTSKKVYVFVMSDGVKIRKFPLNAFVAEGSGAASAETAYRVFGVGAVEAVLAAATIDPATGFLVFSTKVTAKGPTAHTSHYYNDVEQALMVVRKSVAKNSAFDLTKRAIKMEKRFGHLDAILPPNDMKNVRDREARIRTERREKKQAERSKAKQPAQKQE